jgi:glycosyltransferase involved in cell wall biosynthesis
MKVLQINSVCGIGSTGRIATDIHNILIEQGHESYIAYGRDLPKNCNSVIRIGTKIDNYTHVAKTRLFDKHGFGSKWATIEFIKKIKEFDPDIIHLHNIHGYYIHVDILFNYLKEANKPVIWTLHDCWAFTGHCAYFDYIGCKKWQIGCNSCPEKNAYPSSIILDNSNKNFKIKKKLFTGVDNLTIVTPSQWLANLVDKSFLNEYAIKVINNGIDLSKFRPFSRDFRSKYKLKDKFIILGVANVWDRRKGLRYFVELAEKLSKDEVIVLVGLTEKQINQIPKNVIGIRRTNSVEELVDIYSTADLFVNATLEDNFPTTNIEALACGTPVITFNTGGSPESIDFNTGSIINKKNSNEIKNCITEFRKRDFNVLKYSTRKKVMIEFDREILINEYIKLYFKISKEIQSEKE